MSMTDETADRTEDRPDGVDFLDTGRVRFWIDGSSFLLRLPKVGEFKRFRMMMIVDGEAEDHRPLSVRTSEGFDMVERWMRDVFIELSDRKLPDDIDEWPAWLIAPNLPARMLVHWRDVPLAPGAQPPK